MGVCLSIGGRGLKSREGLHKGEGLYPRGVCIQGGLHPGESASRGGLHPSRGVLHPGGSASSGGLHPGVLHSGGIGQTPESDTRKYDQRAGSKHPTGMHSCS